MGEIKRLSVNVNEQCANALNAYASAHGCTVTEAVRRSISLLNHYDVQTQLGNRLALLNGEGEVVQVWEFL
jgi:hypothetical protein